MYMLTGEAKHWWRGTSQMLIDRGVVVDWVCFKRDFLEKYFPESVRHAREAEFMRLQQGEMSVTKYDMRFKHLARFYTQATSEAWKCRKFAEGLKYDLRRVVVPMAITEFPALLHIHLYLLIVWGDWVCRYLYCMLICLCLLCLQFL
uniref:Retrotransposon gag domain-containing protein n=1 Tax=Cajanus cajan TaxID=3821 RepID=A0A151UDN8_CAJCA